MLSQIRDAIRYCTDYFRISVKVSEKVNDDYVEISVGDRTHAGFSIGKDQAERDTKTLEHSSEEAREALNQNLKFVHSIDNQAGYVLRLNILIIGLLFTATSLLISEDILQITSILNSNFSIVLFLAFIITALSITLAFLSYQGTRAKLGLSPNDIEEIRSEDIPYKEYLNILNRSYIEWMRKTTEWREKDGRKLYWCQLCLFLSMALYAIGFMGLGIENLP